MCIGPFRALTASAITRGPARLLPRTKSQSNDYRFDGLPRFLLMRARNGRRRFQELRANQTLIDLMDCRGFC